MIKPAPVCVAAEASPVGQGHEGSNWFCCLKGGVHFVAQEPKHYFIIMCHMGDPPCGGWQKEKPL
eukprot:515605-Pelagomonas_calceolata.AAC.1